MASSPSRRAHGRPWILVLAGIAGLAVSATGCISGQRSDDGTPTRIDARARDAEEIAVLAALESMTRAVETENTFAFMDQVSDRYSPSPLILKSAFDSMLLDHLGYTFHLRTTHFHREEDDALMIVEWRFGRSHRQSGAITWESGQAELRFRRENGAWKLFAQTGDPLFEAPRPS